MPRVSNKAAAKAVRSTDESLARMNAALDLYLRTTGQQRSVVVLKTTADVTREASLRSPVRYGRFRAAWNQALERLGAPPVAIPAVVRHVRPDGKVELVKTDPLEIAAGKLSGRISIEDTDDRTRVEVGNPTRYGPYLEAGSSRQAPNGVVRVPIERHRRAFLDDVKRIRPGGVK